MAFFLLELPTSSGQTRVDGTKAMLVEADSAAEARNLAAAEANGDANWSDSSVTITDVTTLSAADYLGVKWRITVRNPILGGAAGIIEQVEYVGIASDTIDLAGAALVTALNATGSIAGALYTGASNTLTVAAVADNLGDKSLQVEVIFPSAEEGVPGVVGVIVDEGIVAAVLTVVLTDQTAIPKLMKQFKS